MLRFVLEAEELEYAEDGDVGHEPGREHWFRERVDLGWDLDCLAGCSGGQSERAGGPRVVESDSETEL